MNIRYFNLERNPMKLYQPIVVILALSLVSACANAPSKKLDEKISQEGSVQQNADLDKEADTLFKNAPGLNDVQRAQLAKIRISLQARRADLHKESLQLRSVLVKDIVSGTEHVEEIKLIKNRLREIESKRLDILFDSIDQADHVLGKYAAEHQKEMEDTLREDRMGRSEN
jgi:hypothetical protein